ncbi:MAG: hypothetical protein Wins2KO_02240 [Winogradskyella sp.]
MSILALVFASCSQPDVNSSNQNEDPSSISELNVPEGFNYETNKTIHLDIKMPSTISFDDYRSRFSIYSDDDSDLGKHLISGSFNNQGEFSDNFSVPVTLDKLYFKSPVMDSLISISSEYTEQEFVIIDLEELYNYNTEDDYPIEDLDTDRRGMSSNDHNLAKNGSILVNGDFTIDNFGNTQNFGAFTPEDEGWNFIIGGRGNTPMTWYEDNGNGMVGTTDAGTHQFGVVQTFAANPGDLIDFQTQTKAVNNNGININYRIIARNANGGGVGGYAALNYYPPKYEWTTKNVMLTMPANTAYCTVEAIGGDWTNTGRILFDNFSVTGVTDADGDGVEDDLDEFPNDPNKAFSYYYPNEEDYGTLAFEDTWPGRGDYDFNDVVVDYQYQLILNANNDMVGLDVDFKFKASGAGYQNGFGFQMELPSSQVASVTGASLEEGIITTSSNGAEAGQSKATIIVADNVFNILNHPGGGTGVNTNPDLPYVEPESVNISINFTQPVSISDAGYAPYNPFIFVNGERGKEVHLPGYAPTDLVDTSYFGTSDDDTNLSLGKYYLTNNNLPWGINLPSEFSYPVEGVEILRSYTRFGQWAQSSGFSFMDWFVERPGYRNNTNIYSN